MDVAMMQPAFMPWQGLFELIYKSEIFIFLDDFQFSVQSYHQRNRLFVNRGQVDWYSVPIMKSISFKSPLNQTKINENYPWRSKMWRRIHLNYSKAPYYKQVAPHIEKWLLTETESLAEQNILFIKCICELMGFVRDFRMSSSHPSELRSSQRVLELLQWCNADRYFCARGSFGYMKDESIFPVNEVVVLFQNFSPCEYPQVGSPDKFIPFLSVVDALMNIGPIATSELILKGTMKWSTWEDMIMDNLSV